MQGNLLTGTLPASISSLPAASSLSLRVNDNLIGGTVPSTYSVLAATFLNMNSQLYGTLPPLVTVGTDGGYLIGTGCVRPRSLSPAARRHSDKGAFSLRDVRRF